MNYNGRDYWSAGVTLTPAAQKQRSAAAITDPYTNAPVVLTFFVSCRDNEATVAGTLAVIADTMGTIEKSYEIVVIDDGSKDRSAERVRSYMDAHPGMNIVLRINRKRKGAAQNYVDAAFIGSGQYFWRIDGGLLPSMETMVDVLKSLGEADILLPYYLPGLREEGRRLSSRMYARTMQIFVRHRIHECGEEAVHLRHNVMRWHVDAPVFCFREALLARLLDLGFTVKQVPCRRAPHQAARNAALGWLRLIGLFYLLPGIILRRSISRF